MEFEILAIAVFAGVLNPFLSGMNATLSKSVSQPVWAAAGASVFTGVTGTVAMIVWVILDHYGLVGFP